MECKEFERLIPDYIERKMNYATLKHFSEHMEHCDSCREEMVIQLLVTEGVQRLEEGGTFDLKEELNQRVEEARRKIKVHDIIVQLGIVLEVLVIALLIGIFFRILL